MKISKENLKWLFLSIITVFSIKISIAQNRGSLWLEINNPFYRGIYYNRGNVGIGTDQPSSLLHVNGTITTTGFRLPGGTDGDVLTFQSDGTAAWETSSNSGSLWSVATNGITYNPTNTNSNVGIGVSNPSEKLHVNGRIYTTGGLKMSGSTNSIIFGDDANSKFTISRASSSKGIPPQSEMINILTINGDNNMGIGIANPGVKLDVDGTIRTNTEYTFSDANDGLISFGSSERGLNLKIISKYNAGSKSTINGLVITSNGNVGIGLDNPVAKLHVSGKTQTINFQMDNGDCQEDYVLTSTDENGNATWTDISEMIVPGVWNENGNVAYYDGAIGIGTQNVGNTHKLVVAGSINAELIKVTETVPQSDYVFESDYKLMPLSELENYINTHKHLPEVMSAEEFAQDGYSIGEMDDVLLRKVEELTLYVIDQDKTIKEQSNALKEQSETLQQQQRLLLKQQLLIDQLLKSQGQ